jgi:Rrf2 family transcriptional regulator, nitric oxide-sensitive transcriptional repressor
MNITRFTDYALRVLIYLSVNEQEPVTIKGVAESYNISKNHLMKVVQELSAQGFVEATRGKNGGIKLNLQPEQINIGELVRKFEQSSTLVECFGSNNQCVITPACQLKNIFSGAMESFFLYLDKYALSDLITDSYDKQLTEIFFSSSSQENGTSSKIEVSQ